MIIQRADVEHLHALYYVLEFLVNQVQLLLVHILIEESGLARLSIKVAEVAGGERTELPAGFLVEVCSGLPEGGAITACPMEDLALLSCIVI